MHWRHNHQTILYTCNNWILQHLIECSDETGLMFQTLLSAARNLCGEKRQEIQKCFWSQIQVMNVAGRSLHLLQNQNIVGNPMQEMWHASGRKSKWKFKIHLKSQWQLPTMSNPSEKMSVHKCGNVISRNTVSKNEEIRLGDMPPEKWRNWRKGVRGPQWPSENF